jgi:hypothetical protein
LGDIGRKLKRAARRVDIRGLDDMGHFVHWLARLRAIRGPSSLGRI